MVPAPSALVPAAQGVRRLTRVALCDYLGPREPRRHLYSLVADYPRRGGRMLRPEPLIATGAPSARDSRRRALGLAIGCSTTPSGSRRRGDESDEAARPADAARPPRVDVAVNVGDALTLSASGRSSTTARRSASARDAGCSRSGAHGPGDGRGQAIELGWRRDNAARARGKATTSP